MRHVLCATALLLSSGLAAAEPPVKGEAGDPPAPRRPAVVRSVMATATSEESGINPAASGFPQAIGKRDDEPAYDLTTADYRKEYPKEEFKKEADKLRKEMDLKRLRFQVFAGAPAAGDQPRRAIAIWPTKAITDRRSITVVLILSLENGVWRVSDADLYEPNTPGGRDFLRNFRGSNPGMGPVASAAAGMMPLTGQVTKVDEKSLTLQPIGEIVDGPQPAERTLTIDENTQVFIPVWQEERKTPAGFTTPSYRSAPGKPADLKVGQQALVEIPPGQDRVVRISIEPQP